MKLKLAIVFAGLSGFVALGYELLWYRVVAVLTWGVASSFGLLLGAYLAGLAIGSHVAGLLCREGEAAGEPRYIRRLAVFVALANVVSALVVPLFAWSCKFTDYRVGLLMVSVGAALLGAVLPLLAHFGIEPDHRAGQRLSYIYLANIVGSAGGSLITGFVLMDSLTLRQIAVVLAGLGFLLVALLALLGAQSNVGRGVGVGTAALLAILAFALVPRLYDRLWERLLYKQHDDGKIRFATVIENKSGVIAATNAGMVYGGGAYDGVLNTSIAHDRNGIIRAYAVGAMHPAPKQVLMIGLASGSWAQVIAHHPLLEQMTVVEINPGYLELIAQHPGVAGILKNSKVSIVIDDGRRWLRRNDDRKFDFIVMNTTWHWRAHNTNLLSSEFMRLAREHLLPGGILYFNTTASSDVQLTAARTFPYALRVMNFVAVSDAPFSFDRDRWRDLLSAYRIEGKPVLNLSDEGERQTYASLLRYDDIESRADILQRTRHATVITDDNMIIEWRKPLRYPDMPSAKTAGPTRHQNALSPLKLTSPSSSGTEPRYASLSHWLESAS